MRNGKRHVNVIIERAVQTKDAETNATIYVWHTLHDCWADTTARRGMEVPVEGQIMAQSYVRFDFAFLDVDDVVETDRIVHVETGMVYAIKGILPDLSGKEFIVIDGALLRGLPTPAQSGNVVFGGQPVIYGGQPVNYEG